MKKQSSVRTLTECAVLIALAVVLSFIKIWRMPLGGSVTLVSMLPVCVIGVRYGNKWGFGGAFVYAAFQLFFGITTDGLFAWGLTPGMLIGCMLFDYLVAFTVLGVSGVFRKRGEGGVYLGVILACTLRFVSHFLSGYIIFRNLEQFTLFGTVFANRPLLYSAAYNALFMLPELFLTLVAFAVLMRIPFVKKAIFSTPRAK